MSISYYTNASINSSKPSMHITCHQFLLYNNNGTEYDADNLGWYLSGERASWIYMCRNQFLLVFAILFEELKLVLHNSLVRPHEDIVDR